MAEHYDEMTAVLENVMRLVDDATFLIQGNRLPSAFVLNVIAMEEVGKVVLMRWGELGREVTTQKRTGHLQKQWAVACTLVADRLLPHLTRIILSGSENTSSAIIQLAQDFMDSSEKKFFESVIAKNVDRAKQLGLYEDIAYGMERRDRTAIDDQAVQFISDALRQAVPLLKSDLTLILASVFYEVMPPHQEAILTDAPPTALQV